MILEFNLLLTVFLSFLSTWLESGAGGNPDLTPDREQELHIKDSSQIPRGIHMECPKSLFVFLLLCYLLYHPRTGSALYVWHRNTPVLIAFSFFVCVLTHLDVQEQEKKKLRLEKDYSLKDCVLKKKLFYLLRKKPIQTRLALFEIVIAHLVKSWINCD